MAALIAVAPPTAVHAQSFQLDFDSVQTGVADMRGGNWILEGGLTPEQTYGAASSRQVHPLGAPAYCGNGVKENAEACDGTDVGTATCASNGFSQGSLSCTSSCIVSTAGCSNAASGGGQEAAVTQGGGGGGGGRRNPPVQNAQKPSETSALIPAPTPHSNEINTPHLSSPTEQGEPKPTGALRGAAPKIPVVAARREPPSLPAGQAAPAPSTSLEAEPVSLSGAEGAGTPAAGEALLKAPEANESPPAQSPIANAVALGSMSLSEAGILGRLAWMARLKSLYGVIPAFT